MSQVGSWRSRGSGAVADRSPAEVVRQALEDYPDLLMTTGFNLNGVVLLDVAVGAGFRGEVVFVDTGSHFPETLQTRDRVAKRYPMVEVVTLVPEGGGLPRCGSEQCCERRKVSPLRRYLAEQRPGALLTARSRYQSETRAGLELIERLGERVRINPLAYRSRDELEHYADERRLPINTLYHRGFASIGCAPTTRALLPGEEPRAGRWDGQAKIECGLWEGEGAL
jgi:phosphoadenosine phosphosulfate reductase